jgi:thiamine biosynthesis protein ThiS
MHIRLNGEPKELASGATVLSLLHDLAIDPRVVAVEHNRIVVKRDRYGETLISEGAEVEIVAFVGGGAPSAPIERPRSPRRSGAALSGAIGGGAPSALRKVGTLLLLALTLGSSLLAQTPAQSRQASEEVAAIASGYALLAKGDFAEASRQAQLALATYPRSIGALVLAVDVETARGGAMAGLGQYETWLRDRRTENVDVLRRIATSYLREVVASKDPMLARAAEHALADDGDTQAKVNLIARGQQGNLKDVQELTRIGYEPAVRSLLTTLKSAPNAGMRIQLIEALIPSKSPLAVQPLVDLLKDQSLDVRAAAASALGKLGTSAVIPSLRPLMSDSSTQVKIAAAGALYRLNDPIGLPYLLERLQMSEWPMLQVQIADLMSSHPDATWQATVRSLAQSRDPNVRRIAARLILPHDAELGRSVLTELMKDQNPIVQQMAGMDLASHITGDFATLRQLLRSSDGPTRVQAADRLLELTR